MKDAAARRRRMALWIVAVIAGLIGSAAAQQPPEPSRVVVVVHGGAGEVAGSLSVLDTGNGRWMVDCGTDAPDREGSNGPKDAAGRSATLPVDGRSIAAVFLTHAHTDHVGRLPLLVQEGFVGPIFATPGTLQLLPVMLRMQIRYDEGRKRQWSWSLRTLERSQNSGRPVTVHWHAACRYRAAIAPENLRSAAASLDELGRRFEQDSPGVEIRLCQRCVEEEAASILALCRPVDYDAATEVAPGVAVTFLYAGHIPGSASVVFEVRLAGARRRVLFSGDVGNDLSPLFPGPKPAPEVDAAFIETTYGPTFRDASVHEERSLFRRSVGAAVDRGAVAWIPAFALDRTQRILHELCLAQREGVLSPDVPIYCSSPTAAEITAIYARNRRKGWFRQPVADDPKAWSPSGLRTTPGLPENLSRPCVLLTTSGMLDFGASRALIGRLVPQASSAIFLVGYQDPDSPGGRLMKAAGLLREGTRDQASLKTASRPASADDSPKASQAAVLDWNEDQLPVHAAVHYFRCFSAHADAKEMDAWLSKVPRGATVVLVHGGPWELAGRAKQLAQQGWQDVRIAKPGEPIVLTPGK